MLKTKSPPNEVNIKDTANLLKDGWSESINREFFEAY